MGSAQRRIQAINSHVIAAVDTPSQLRLKPAAGEFFSGNSLFKCYIFSMPAFGIAIYYMQSSISAISIVGRGKQRFLCLNKGFSAISINNTGCTVTL